MIAKVLIATDAVVMGYFLLLNLVYLILIVAAFMHLRRHMHTAQVIEHRQLFRHPALARPVSVLVPAYNEERTILESVNSLLSLEYPEFEVVVINDGSRDETLARLRERFDLRPVNRAAPGRLPTAPIRQIYQSATHDKLIVLDKENGGKADALNAGVNVSRYPLLAAIDTDSLLEPSVLLQLARPFLEDPDVVAVGGVVRIVNGCRVEHGRVTDVSLPRNLLARIQVLEYMRAFLYGRVGWGQFGMLLVISGALGMFRRDAVVSAQGFLRDTVGEDMELVVRLHRGMREQRRRYRVAFIPEPVCWTEVPESWRVLGRQRDRWQRGLLDCLWTHRAMALNPRYGRIGLIALPFFIVFEALGPVLELFGFVAFAVSAAMGLVDLWFALAFLGAAVLLGLSMSLGALVLEQTTSRRYATVRMHTALMLVSLAENFGYRQISSVWRLMGTVNFLRGVRTWGEMKRKGFSTP